MNQVSVVIPCFNAEEYIRETLESVAAQRVEGCETIVVDDGSTDRSARIVASEFPWVRLLRTVRGGPSRARNLGTSVAAGDFIQYLDADDVLAEGKIDRQREALSVSGADVAYGGWQELQRAADGRWRVTRTIDRRMVEPPEIELFTDFWSPPAAYLFRRGIVERVGGWNESLPIIQDARFALDCALRSGRFVFCPGNMAFYRAHSGGSVSKRDPVGFVRDCFRNALEVADWWQANGGLSAPRKEALLKVLGNVARASFVADPPTFESAYQVLERLSPGYVPKEPRTLAHLSTLIGYRRAEYVAWVYRRGKRFFKRRVAGR